MPAPNGQDETKKPRRSRVSQLMRERRQRLAESDDADDFIAAVQKLSRDLRKASEDLSEDEAGYLVMGYYNLQEIRIRCDAQVITLHEAGKPFDVIGWLAEQSWILESQIRAALDRYSGSHRFGDWPRSICGIGPVIAAGLIANTHMDHLVTAGHLWSFAGLNPEAKWEKGQKRPWNSDLKVLCWKIGQSFMKVQNRPDDVYGKVYKKQKELYIARNDAGGFKDNAKEALLSRNWDKTKPAYTFYASGRLPPGHIDAMARRYAVKLFLGHYWQVCWDIENPGVPPVLPYPILHMRNEGHMHMIEPPRNGSKPQIRTVPQEEVDRQLAELSERMAKFATRHPATSRGRRPNREPKRT